MAIIRKGDKKAERELSLTANLARYKELTKISDSRKQKTGRAFISKDKTAITGDPNKLTVTKNKKGKTTASYRGQPYEGPVSGTAIARTQNRTEKRAKNLGSGVVKGGRTVKGSSVAIGVAKVQREKKKKGK